MECWKNQKAERNLDASFHYSTTPPLHHSADFGMKERHQEPPLELVQSRALPYLAVSMACIFQMFPQLCSAKGDVGFQIADCGLRIADCGLRISDLRLRL